MINHGIDTVVSFFVSLYSGFNNFYHAFFSPIQYLPNYIQLQDNFFNDIIEWIIGIFLDSPIFLMFGELSLFDLFSRGIVVFAIASLIVWVIDILP